MTDEDREFAPKEEEEDEDYDDDMASSSSTDFENLLSDPTALRHPRNKPAVSIQS
jgi:hypothetical protein